MARNQEKYKEKKRIWEKNELSFQCEVCGNYALRVNLDAYNKMSCASCYSKAGERKRVNKKKIEVSNEEYYELLKKHTANGPSKYAYYETDMRDKIK